MTRLAEAEEEERAAAERPRVDAERERVEILARRLEEAQERAAQRAEFERHLDLLRATACEMNVARAAGGPARDLSSEQDFRADS